MVVRSFSLLTRLALRLRGARSFRFVDGETSLRVFTRGPEDGEIWLLLHGLGSSPLAWWFLVDALDEGTRLLIPALSALGGTRSGSAAGLDVHRGVEALHQLLAREVPGRRVSLAGNSLGGWIATRFALAHPEQVERLVLINSGGFRDQDWERIERLVRLSSPEDLEVLFEALFAKVPWYMKAIRPGFYRAYTSEAVTSILATLRHEDAFDGDELSRLEVPTAVIWGEEDGLFTLDVGEAMAKRLPQGCLFRLPGCGHSPQIECPAALAAVIREFRRLTSEPS